MLSPRALALVVLSRPPLCIHLLPPLAPSPLRDFPATTEALTPVGPALRPPTGCMNTVSADRQVSLIHVLDLPFPPSPTTLGPSTSISHATPHLVESPAEAGLGFTFPTQAGRLSGRNEFLIVRMERSPPAAPHPALLRRSCSRLQAGERMPEEDFHLSNQARFQAHVGTRCSASLLGLPSRTRLLRVYHFEVFTASGSGSSGFIRSEGRSTSIELKRSHAASIGD